MAETRIVGSDGAVTMPSATHHAKIRTFSLNVGQAVTDVSAFGDAWRGKRGGIKEGRGSVGGVMSRDATSTGPGLDDADVTGSSITLSAYETATTCGWTGTVIMSNIAVTSTEGGEAGITFDFEFDGAVTESWDETG